jgi:hypothetical protein
MKVVVESVLPCSAERAWDAVCTSGLLVGVASPLVAIRAADDEALPPRWPAQRTVRVRSYLFGLIPLGTHVVYLERIDAAAREIQSRKRCAGPPLGPPHPDTAAGKRLLSLFGRNRYRCGALDPARVAVRPSPTAIGSAAGNGWPSACSLVLAQSRKHREPDVSASVHAGRWLTSVHGFGGEGSSGLGCSSRSNQATSCQAPYLKPTRW